MKKFYAIERRDTAIPFINALLANGYERTQNYKIADFLLYDKCESTSSRIGDIIKSFDNKVRFIYPHTSYSWWFWDGFIEPKPCSCNFVVGNAAIRAMTAYGYPYRIEAIGFPRCEVKPFHSTAGKHLHYSSARLIGVNGSWPDKLTKEYHIKTMDWLVKYRKCFDKITVTCMHSMERNCLTNYTHYGFEFIDLGSSLGHLNAMTAIKQMEDADIIISCNTFGHLAIANGYPAILYSKIENPVNRFHYLKHIDLYKHLFEFPLDLFSMTGDEVLALREKPHPLIEEWKHNMIGESFDANKFISVVREFV